MARLRTLAKTHESTPDGKIRILKTGEVVSRQTWLKRQRDNCRRITETPEFKERRAKYEKFVDENGSITYVLASWRKAGKVVDGRWND